MNKKILKILNSLEDEYNITIYYACESGSRAWGFDNSESDYDIRFIYKMNDLKDYLRISNRKDVISYNNDPFDIVGWDIKKALWLHYKSNPNLREWLISNKVYINDNYDIFTGLDEFNKSALMHHYMSIAVRHDKKYIPKDLSNVNINITKKLLYIIRCILSWNLLNENKYPPINIFELMDDNNIDEYLKKDIFALTDYHKNLCSYDLDESIIFNLKAWTDKSLEYMKANTSVEKSNKDINKYDSRFYELITDR